ncbi:MAG: cellulase family glycosylhydrolase [Sedimentisphaerales bacterium]|nr:cellulase family glycosylhydrolase [Sedimentisphaerales bacterium]
MRCIPIWILLLCTSLLWAQDRTIFFCDFDKDTLPGSGEGQIVKGYKDTQSLQIERSDPGSTNRRYTIDPALLSDPTVTMKATVKAEGISKRPNPWNGIKVMLMLETEGGYHWPQIQIPGGDFDWRDFAETIRLPAHIKRATLVVGLEEVRGRVWFDNLEIHRGRPSRSGKRYPAIFSGHDLPRLRGVMYGPTFKEEDFRDLAGWNANQIRWQLNWVPMKAAEEWARDMDAYDKWLDGALLECDKALAACEKYRIKVLVDLHCPPGGRAEDGVCRMFQEKRYQDHLLQIWDKVATRYKGRSVVYAYDLLNEAVEGTVSPDCLHWRDLATEAARVIRRIDPDKPVVFEPSPWGSADGFDTLSPLDLDRVIYSFHMYQPHQFTHQGVYEDKQALAYPGVAYPGVINGQMWDKEQLRRAMMPAIEFQKEFNVQIYVGEFSAIRWAPGRSAYLYLRDCIELFEEYGWDWSYHAFREWDGWSVEHTGDRSNRRPSAEPTERQQLLVSYFTKNQRP